MAVEIKEVVSRRELKKFVAFQNNFYKDNSYYVPTLVFDEMNILRNDKNPAFDFCDVKYWLAYKNGEIAGRIAGIINHNYISKWGNKYARFGWIDFIDDYEVSNALFETLCNWAKVNGLNAIHGPLGFTDMDKEGLLIDGFDQMGSIATIYNYPYYPTHFEKFGLTQDADWVQFSINVPQEIPSRIADYSAILMDKYKLKHLDTKNSKDLLPYAKKLFKLLNIAYENLYGVTPLTDKQIDYYIKQYFGFIRHEFVSITLDENNEIVAFSISIPSLANAIRKTKGNVFPFGFIHILRALKKNDTIEFFLVGIRPDYQNKGINALIIHKIHNAMIKAGIKTAITYPELENNKKVTSLWKYFDTNPIIKRRCYIKHI